MSAPVVATLVLGFGLFILNWVYRKIITPPTSKHCNGFQVTSPRITLRDGRCLAYKEQGVPKYKAKYKVIGIHGFNNPKEGYFGLSQQFMESLGLYIVVFDRAGYGESDANPNRSIYSDTLDVEELADKLELGSKFYVVGISLANYVSWGCLKYIPHRLAGIAFVVPVINYRWPSFPSKLCHEANKRLSKGDRLTAWIAYYAPQFLYWWMTQKWFPPPIVARNPVAFNSKDIEIFEKWKQSPKPNEHKIRRGWYESLHRDVKIALGKWEFDPMELKNPFPGNEGSVHLWQGYEDKVVYYPLQRFVVEKLPWIKYHEIPDCGHLMIHDEVMCEKIFKCLVLG